jgi:hypothetical protein
MRVGRAGWTKALVGMLWGASGIAAVSHPGGATGSRRSCARSDQEATRERDRSFTTAEKGTSGDAV